MGASIHEGCQHHGQSVSRQLRLREGLLRAEGIWSSDIFLTVVFLEWVEDQIELDIICISSIDHAFAALLTYEVFATLAVLTK